MIWCTFSNILALNWTGYVYSAFSPLSEIEAINGLILTALTRNPSKGKCIIVSLLTE